MIFALSDSDAATVRRAWVTMSVSSTVTPEKFPARSPVITWTSWRASEALARNFTMLPEASVPWKTAPLEKSLPIP